VTAAVRRDIPLERSHGDKERTMKTMLSFCGALLAALALAACGSDGGAKGGGSADGSASGAQASADAAPKSGATTIRNRHNEDLLALDDSNRRIGLVRAIRGTGNRCPRQVEPNPVYQGDYQGMALWTGRCDNNEQYAIFLAPNGDVQVRNCRDMAQLHLPACRTLPPARPSVPPRRSTLPPTPTR